jgi:hypothetical protein
VTVSGDYTIEPYETPGGVKALTIIGGPNRGHWHYSLEYRQPIGFDTIMSSQVDPINVFNGVVFHLVLTTPELLRMTPADPSSQYYSDPSIVDTPALTVGQRFCDKDAKVAITILSASSTGAKVRVKFGGKC